MINFFELLKYYIYKVPEDEQERYKNYIADLFVERLNIAYILCIVLMPGAFIFDMLIFPENWIALLQVRIIFTLVCVLMFYLSNKTFLKKYPSGMSHILCFVISFGIVYLCSLTGYYASSYYAGLMLVFLSIAMIFPWDIKNAVAQGIAIIVLHISWNLLPFVFAMEPIEWPAFWNSIYFLSFVFGVVMISSGMTENYRRKLFIWGEELRVSRDETQNYAEQLEDKEKEKTQFISNITHELKTPLSIIVGHTELIMEKLGSTNEFLVDPLKQIQQSAFQLATHVDRIIKVSAMDTPEEKLNLDNYNYIGVVRNIFSLFEAKAKDENINYVLNVPKLTLVVQIDIVKVEEILRNLIQNAFKFIHFGGTITVSVLCDGSRVYTEVSDTGEGIPRDKLDRIFERMYQAGDVLSKQHGGIGLGLYICKKNAEAHQGTITVNSQVGQGSTFCLTLPVHIDQDVEIKNAGYEGPERRKKQRRKSSERRMIDRRMVERQKKFEYQQDLFLDSAAKISSAINVADYENRMPEQPSILIVEDTYEMMQVMVQSLGDEYNLILARNAFEALDKLNKHQDIISLILSDIMMPGMSGFEFCEKVMLEEQFKHIPFIFVTALLEEETQLVGFELGATDYIVKPFNIRILKEKVAHWIARRNYEFLLKQLSLSLDDKVQVISKLKDIMLHEIRNPLQMLSGAEYFLRKLRDTFYDKSSTKEKKWWKDVDKIKKGLDSLLAVLETSKQLEIPSLVERKAEKIGDVLNEAVGQTSHFMKDIKFSINLQDSIAKSRFLCSKKMLNQVFVNLIRNATEAVKEKKSDGKGAVEINCSKDSSFIHIQVTDNGIGISEKDQEGLFKFKFTTKKEGTGIGLHLSKKFIELHGGNIEVKSQEKEGATFTVSLPVERKKLKIVDGSKNKRVSG